MNYRELFHIAMQMIPSPTCAWGEIYLEEDRRKVFIASVYPMVGLCGLLAFIGSLIAGGWGGPQSSQYAMTRCCTAAVSLSGGYFLAAYFINGLHTRMFVMNNDVPPARQFAGYTLVVLFLLKIIISILPDFSTITLLLQFYIIYVVWEGSAILMKIAEKDCLRFTIPSSTLLIACPIMIESIFNKLMVALN